MSEYPVYCGRCGNYITVRHVSEITGGEFCENCRPLGDALIHSPIGQSTTCTGKDKPEETSKALHESDTSGTHDFDKATMKEVVEKTCDVREITDNASCANQPRIYCKYCGAKLKKDHIGLVCPQNWTHNNDETTDNKGCGKIEEEVFEGKVIETYVCGTRASEFNAVYLCDKCRTTDNKGCANPPKSLREYYLGEGEFDFERKIKKEMITDSPGKYSEEYQALKKFGSDKADCANSEEYRPNCPNCKISVFDKGNHYNIKEKKWMCKTTDNQNYTNKEKKR